MLRITIPYATPSGNVVLRTHWAEKRKMAEDFAWHIQPQVRGVVTIDRARVNITRHGSRTLDTDNLVGGCKILIDVLKPGGRGNVYGLGVIAGDEPHRLTVEYAQAKSPRAAEWTEIEIWADDPE